MTVKIPSSLKWLIDKRARLHGRLLREQNDLQRRQAQAELEIEQLTVDLAALDRILSIHEIPISPDLIEPANTQGAERLSEHGKITANIFRCLKEANGEPCSTTYVAAYVIKALPEQQANKPYPELRLSVRKLLKTLASHGKIRRLHPPKSNAEGYWASL